ncbi:hypothetical protein EJ110_NYTH44184 [Nymphaea thermarum]|nr:hypothetical protein EJ110_NYTH44184 [Nymphaea thermarum]
MQTQLPTLSQCIVPVFFPPQPAASDADPATHQPSTVREINQQHDGLFQQAEEERKRLLLPELFSFNLRLLLHALEELCCSSLISPSPQEYQILGLNLLRLLVQNRIAEFHTELELLPASALENPCIKHAV